MSTAVDLARPQRIHIVGAGGAGMSAIGIVLAAMGNAVSGSDMKDSPALDRLRSLGLDVRVGHDPSHIEGAGIVAVSSAIRPDNPEVVAAQRKAIPVVSRADMLAAIAATRSAIAVAGTHGKTTTSSMLALVLVEAGLDPSFIIGGELNEIGSGAVLGDGPWMVIEADESDGTFLRLGVQAAIITNIEPDHIDHYGSFDSLVASFAEFAAAVDGPVVLSADDERAVGIAAAVGERAVTYGTSPDAAYRIIDPEVTATGVSFRVQSPTGDLGRFSMPVPGLHVARNATAALSMAVEIGADVEAARRALARFSGVARRYQMRGTYEGVAFVDDYAHLPGEIAATVATALAGGWERVVCVFQPHRYSRIASLWESFGGAFDGAHEVVVTDIYPAGERPIPGVSGELVVRAVREARPGTPVSYIPERASLAADLRSILRSGDICLVLSAGDLVGLAGEIYPESGTP